MASFTEQYRVKPGAKVDLGTIDPRKTWQVKDKEAAQALVIKNRQRLHELQYALFAEDRRSLLIVLQGMDTGGKDGTIRHVMTGLNPQGCRVYPFKAPSAEERDHDYLWRVHARVPPRGEIGIFNRSHYEDVLVVRVHDLVPKKDWSRRYEQINRFERNLAETGTTILKFFLYISKDEQKERLEERLADPSKHWKFNPGDLEERKLWDRYVEAYEAALSRCSKAHAPWFVVPADRKWFRNIVVSEIVRETLEDMNPRLPEPGFDVKGITVE